MQESFLWVEMDSESYSTSISAYSNSCTENQVGMMKARKWPE